MGKGMRLRHPARLPLQMIIADATRGIQRLVDIARLQQIINSTGPDPAQAICLQFQPHGQRIRARFAAALARLLHRVQNTQLVLDMMGDLMRDHISGGKIAARTQLLRQRGKKFSVQICLAIRRAIERPGGAGCATAWAARHAGKQHQNRRGIVDAGLSRQNLAPDLLGTAQDAGAEIGGALFFGAQIAGGGLHLLPLDPLQQRGHVNPREIPDSQHDQQAGTANTRTAPGTTPAPAILDITAGAQSFQSHGMVSDTGIALPFYSALRAYLQRNPPRAAVVARDAAIGAI